MVNLFIALKYFHLFYLHLFLRKNNPYKIIILQSSNYNSKGYEQLS